MCTFTSQSEKLLLVLLPSHHVLLSLPNTLLFIYLYLYTQVDVNNFSFPAMIQIDFRGNCEA